MQVLIISNALSPYTMYVTAYTTLTHTLLHFVYTLCVNSVSVMFFVFPCMCQFLSLPNLNLMYVVCASCNVRCSEVWTIFIIDFVGMYVVN